MAIEAQDTHVPDIDAEDEAQKIVIYVMPDRGAKARHKFLVMRRTEKNHKGRYVTREEFFKAGLFWPNGFVKSREELASRIGEAVLDEANIDRTVRCVNVHCEYGRGGTGGMFQVVSLTEGDEDVTHLVDLGIHFDNLDALKRYLERHTGDDFDLEEV